MQHEPGVRRALADAAVGDRPARRRSRPCRRRAPQLVGRLEGAVLADAPGPTAPRPRRGCGPRAARPPARSRAWRSARPRTPAASGRPPASCRCRARRATSSRIARIAVVARPRALNCGRRVARHVGRGRAALGDPLLARAVHQLHVVVAVVLEVPVRVGGEPVVAVAVEHDRVLVRDPAAAEQRAELVRAEEVALDLVLEVASSSRSRSRPGCAPPRRAPGFSSTSTMRIESSSRWSSHPLRVDQYVLRVVGHGAPASYRGRSLALTIYDRRRPVYRRAHRASRRRGRRRLGGDDRARDAQRVARARATMSVPARGRYAAEPPRRRARGPACRRAYSTQRCQPVAVAAPPRSTRRTASTRRVTPSSRGVRVPSRSGSPRPPRAASSTTCAATTRSSAHAWPSATARRQHRPRHRADDSTRAISAVAVALLLARSSSRQRSSSATARDLVLGQLGPAASAGGARSCASSIWSMSSISSRISSS